MDRFVGSVGMTAIIIVRTTTSVADRLRKSQKN